MVVSGSQGKALNDFQLVNIQGKLTGHGIEEQLPTIAIVAHYDAFGVAPVSKDFLCTEKKTTTNYRCSSFDQFVNC